jgi:hypothetical protein
MRCRACNVILNNIAAVGAELGVKRPCAKSDPVAALCP